MEEKKINICGLNVNYKVAGSGQPVLILHGWGGSSDSWVKVQQILAEQGYRVIVPDFSGFGKTITPPKPWGIGEYTDFILEFTKGLSLERFFLLGHSFGGRIAVEFSSRYPEKIEKLILCNSAGIKPEPGLRTTALFLLARIGNAVFSKSKLSRFKDHARNIFYLFLRKKDYVKAANKIMRETIKKVLDEDLSLNLPKIKTATLVIWGKEDKLVPVKYAYIFNEKISGSRLEIMPKIGHAPHLEDPESLSEKILDFLKKQ